MHKPDFEPGQTVHVKRLVVAIARDDVDTRLHGPQDEAAALVRLTSVELFAASPTTA